MRVHTIEVDEDVFRYLQQQAQPLVDTPNTVLRRLLLDGTAAKLHRQTSQVAASRFDAPKQLPSMPFGTPAALQQILWVVYRVRTNHRSRPEATADVAQALGVAPQTVLDKYTRQLGFTAMRFDLLLREPTLAELRSILTNKFPGHEETIRQFLSGLQAAA